MICRNSDRYNDWYRPPCFYLSYTKWTWLKEDTPPPSIGKLNNQFNFSAEFKKILGQDKHIDITDPKNEHIAIQLFADMVEYAATMKYLLDYKHEEVELRSFGCKQPYLAKFGLDRNGKLYWGRGGRNVETGSCLDMIGNVFNISRNDAIATLASALGMDFLKMIRMSSKKHQAYTDSFKRLSCNFPEFLPSLVPFDAGNIGSHYNYIPILGFSGEIIGAVVVYVAEKNKIYFPATVIENELSIGKYAPTAYFLNQDKLDKFPNVPVLVFQDISIAIKLQEMLGNNTKHQPEFIITSHFGNDLSVLPWNFLYGHDVIIVPKIDEMSLATIKLYSSYCQDHRIGEFKIANTVIGHGTKIFLDETSIDELSEAEKTLLQNAIWIDGLDYPQVFIRNLQKEGISLEDFENFWKKVGVFKDNAANKSEPEIYSLPSIPDVLKPQKATTLSDISVPHIIRGGTTIMLVGMKNAGKTQTSYIFTGAFLGIKNLPWPFDKNDVPFVGNACIIDGETPHDEILENLSQHGLKAELNKRLFLYPSSDEQENTINDEEYRVQLKKFLVENNCRLLVLDNMKALMGDKVGQPDAVQKVFAWVRELQKQDICILYLLHKDEEAPKTSKDKNKGASTFREMARCIANIIGANEIIADKLGTEEVQASAQNDGLTCGIQFPTCKTAPRLEKLIAWVHLPFEGKWQLICITDTNGKKIELPGNNLSSGGVGSCKDNMAEATENDKASDTFPPLPPLSTGAQRVYEAMKKFPGGECAIGELAGKFSDEKGMGRDTIRDKYLKELMQAGLVVSLGENPRDMKYRIVRKD